MRIIGPIIILMGCPSIALGQLSSTDILDPAGVPILGGATRNPATKLDWLDLTLTDGVSIDDILAGAGPGVGWTNDGWRYATSADICVFFGTYAGAPTPCPNVASGLFADPADASALVNLLGANSSLPSASAGHFDDSSTGAGVRFGLGLIDSTGFVRIENDVQPTNLDAGGFGSYLVRDEMDPVFECSDGIDNDDDLLIDFPEDPGCDSLIDNDETGQSSSDSARIFFVRKTDSNLLIAGRGLCSESGSLPMVFFGDPHEAGVGEIPIGCAFLGSEDAPLDVITLTFPSALDPGEYLVTVVNTADRKVATFSASIGAEQSMPSRGIDDVFLEGGNLIVVLTDGTRINAGAVPPGPEGPEGPAGPQGPPGPPVSTSALCVNAVSTASCFSFCVGTVIANLKIRGSTCEATSDTGACQAKATKKELNALCCVCGP